MLQELAGHPSTVDPDPFAGPDHPMRRLTRAVALGEPWTAADATRVATVFDSLAAEWSARHVDEVRAAPVIDALQRGDLPASGRWLEIGSGTGAWTPLLSEVAGSLAAVDLSGEMLRRAPDGLASRLQADAATLPFPDDTFDAVVMVNMLLFPAEVDRVLVAYGSIVWVNTLGDQTPIHLPAADVLSALPGAWTGRTARAGTGFWLTARRT